jgi:hypothetical protein
MREGTPPARQLLRMMDAARADKGTQEPLTVEEFDGMFVVGVPVEIVANPPEPGSTHGDET